VRVEQDKVTGSHTVELVADVLIREVPFRQWLDDDRDFLPQALLLASFTGGNR